MSGEGLMGLEGLPSELKDLNVDIVSGIGEAPTLLAKVEPAGLCRRMLGIDWPSPLEVFSALGGERRIIQFSPTSLPN